MRSVAAHVAVGARVVATRILRDHAALPTDGWPGLLADAKAAGAECIVITRKDAVKHGRLPPEVTVVDVQTTLEEGEEELWRRILAVLRP
jgi:tetraacyldisaccharide-1-P 4'-kinase